MSTIQSPRGTRDILPSEQWLWQKVQATAQKVASEMGYLPISTPSYEEIALFQRSIGEGTDVIDKELFLVRGKESNEEHYALRPEATAGLVRSYIQHGMHTWPQPVKLYTLANLFRYDRPQKGRYREHVQFDLEYFGDRGPFADAWVIYTCWRFLSLLGLKGVGLSLNSLGLPSERQVYITELVAFLSAQKERLSPDSKRRLEINPLRILDSKETVDQEICASAPRISAFYSPETQAHFDEVQDYLRSWNIPFHIQEFLVRGLDYYSHTTFEWYTEQSQGQQSALGGGGRYDSLITTLGGQDVGGVGVGLGLDRICEELISQENTVVSAPLVDVYLIAADEIGKKQAPACIELILSHALSVEVNLSKLHVANQMKAANRLGARVVMIIGQQEVEGQHFTCKYLEDGRQEEVKQADLVEWIQRFKQG